MLFMVSGAKLKNSTKFFDGTVLEVIGGSARFSFFEKDLNLCKRD